MMMTTITFDQNATCAQETAASRRFYIHVGSLGFLVAAQPSMFEEVAYALAMSGASRALDQAAQDCEMLSPSGTDSELAEAADELHHLAADALRTSFQCMVHLVPRRFGATELLLGPTEQISAWCYEDGYLTYATDENAAAIMYAETGSLRELRSQIRRSPDFDPSLQMITGQSLFLFDQREGTGPGTAKFYRKQATRLLAKSRERALTPEFDNAAFMCAVEKCISATAFTYGGSPVADSCLSRGRGMVSTLLRSMPTGVPVMAK
jgi:hypothetical protein